MTPISKFLIGAGVTALMAMASHSLFGLGEGFGQTLENRAAAALQGDPAAAGLRVAAVREPSLQRILLLDGAVPAADRPRLEALALAVPGVKAVRWADAGPDASADAAPPAAAPEAPATAAAADTCQQDVDAVIAGKTIQFDSGAATLRPESAALIDQIAKVLVPCTGTLVTVAGHTDGTGNAAANQMLSEQRAGVVVASLVNQGVPAGRLTAVGFGAGQPVQPGRTAAANAANRRIEFAITTGGTAGGNAGAAGESGQ